MGKLVDIIDVIVDNQDPLKPLQFSPLGDIKCHINNQCAGANFRLDTDPTTGDALKFIDLFDEEKKPFIEDNLNELKKNGVLDFKMEWFEPSRKFIAVITKVNPKIESNQELKRKCEAQMAAVETQEVAKPSQIKNPTTKQPSNTELLETQLTDIDSLKLSIQSLGDGFEKLIINGIPIVPFIMHNFDKYSSIADLLVMECICDGKLSLLKNIMSIKHCATVTQSETQRNFKGRFFDNLVDVDKQEINSTRLYEETHSYQLKVNFDIQSFAAYVKGKKLLGTDTEFLGEKEEVQKCLEFVCGDTSVRISVIMAALENSKAFKSLEFLFTF